MIRRIIHTLALVALLVSSTCSRHEEASHDDTAQLSEHATNGDVLAATLGSSKVDVTIASTHWTQGVTPATPEAKAALRYAALARTFGDYRPRRCIAILGQSNAAGRKFIEQVSQPQHDILVGPYANVPLSEWESSFTDPFSVLYNTHDQTGSQTPVRADGPLAPRPYTLVPSAIPNMGTELSVGHGIDFYAPNQWGIIKCAIGGTDLNTQWKPTGTYPSTPPNLYNFCVAYVKAAEKALGCNLAIIYWVQGESDAVADPPASLYEANLLNLVVQFRVAWPGIPVVINRVSSSLGSCCPFKNTIRTAIENVVAATARTGWTNCDGLVLDSGLHFTPDSYVTLGYRAVPVLINAMGHALPPTAGFSAYGQSRTIQFTDLSVDANVGSQVNPPIGGSITAWDYDFGDGSGHATTQNPSHTYSADGVYTVTLVATNSAGVKARSIQTISAVLPTWTTDATSGVGFPSTSAEWTDFETKHGLTAFGVPSNLYTYQQASGSLTDAIGAKNLAVANSPTYSKTITGWSRKAVGGSGASTTQSASNTTYANLNTSSWLVVSYIRMDQPTAANHQVSCGGASGVNCLQAPGANPGMQKRTGSLLKTSTLAHSGASVRPYAILYDNTNHRDCILSDIEKVCNSWVAGTAGTTHTVGFSLSSEPTKVQDILGEFMFRGSAAERSDEEIRHLFRALGWNPSGYGP